MKSTDIKKLKAAIKEGAIGYCLKTDDGTICNSTCKLFDECFKEKRNG